jgi:phosphate/sulfate permease
MNPTAQVPPVFIPAILVPRPFSSVSFAYFFAFAIQSLLLRSTTQLCQRIETSAKKRKKGKKKEKRRKNPLETTWLFVCFNQIKDLDGFVCELQGFFYGYLS